MKKEADFLKAARDRFKLAVEATQEQAAREEEDLKFQIPEEQWTEEARRLREGDEYTPGRPTLSVSKIDQPIQLVINQAKNARLGIDVHPVTEQADDDTAEVLQGIYRRIERDSNAQDGRIWALDRAVKCGRGAYRIGTRYDEDSPETFDQEIYIERILYQESVYFDPTAIQPDWSDGRYVFVCTWLPYKDFKAEFPKARISVSGQEEWQSYATESPEWVRVVQGEIEAVLVAEYWYREIDRQTLTVEIDGEQMSRSREDVTVKVCKLVGQEVVEEPQTWPGRYIPIVPVIGKELQPFDGRRRFYGMIHPVKDGQRFYNFAASTLVERMQLEPKAPFIGYAGQFEGHEEKWQNANLKNYPYLEVNPTTLEGQGAAPLPQRSQVNTQGMTVAMAALQEADQFIQSATAVFEPSLGRLPQKERSGVAIRALQNQMEQGTSHFIVDFANNSMKYEAKVILDLIPKIYDRPGRITQVLGLEGESKPVMLGMPFSEREGQVQPMPFQTNPANGQPLINPQTGGPMVPRGAKYYDLSAGRYTVTTSVGRSHQTRMQEGREEMAQLLQAQPELWPILGPTYLKYLDAPWSAEASELLKRFREMKYPGLSRDKDEEPTAEEAQARAQQMEQQLQQMQQELQKAKFALEIDQAKQQVAMQKAQLEAQVKLQTSQQDNAVKVFLERQEQQMKLLIEEMRQRFDAIEGQKSRTHEKVMEAGERTQRLIEKEADIKFKAPREPLFQDEEIR